MIVMKFGGSSIGNAERMKSVGEIIKSYKEKYPVVVLSAVGGITDKLIESAKIAFSKGVVNISEIKEVHKTILKDLNLNPKLINNELSELTEILEVIIKIKEDSNKIMDIVCSFGERMSTRIFSAYLNSIGMKAQNFDAYDIGMITDSNFGSAEPLLSANEKIKKSFSKVKNIPIITGFIGKDEQGQITTLGRGGSDYTAAIVGAAINAEEIQIWTDVEGIMTSDPKIVKAAKSIPQISFNEAAELATFGAKVLHPKTIQPVVKKNIPVMILNSLNPKSSGTIILDEVENSHGVVKAIALKKDIILFNIASTRMLLAHGFLAKLFEIFNKYKVSIDMIATSEVSVSLTINKTHNNKQLDSLVKELKEISDVVVEKDKTLICLVGKGMKNTVGLLARIFSAVAKKRVSVEMVSQGASEINVGFIVNGKDTEKVVHSLHNEFFG